MSDSIEQVVERGLTAIDDDNFDDAQAALKAATDLVGDAHASVLHLAGMIAWTEGEIEEASEKLSAAINASPEDPQVFLDCAELILNEGLDLAEAERAVNMALALPGLDDELRLHAQLTLAQIRLDDDNPEGALTIVDAMSAEDQQSAHTLETRAMIYLVLDRADEAVKAIEKAIELAGEEPDLYYHLGMCHFHADNEEAAIAAMQRVLKLDNEQEPEQPVESLEAQELSAAVEEIIEELPDDIMKLVAHTPIVVQARPNIEQVAGGADPRGGILFVGDASEGEDSKLTQIILMRDRFIAEADGPVDVGEIVFSDLLNEVRHFFGIDNFSIADFPLNDE